MLVRGPVPVRLPEPRLDGLALGCLVVEVCGPLDVVGKVLG